MKKTGRQADRKLGANGSGSLLEKHQALSLPPPSSQTQCVIIVELNREVGYCIQIIKEARFMANSCTKEADLSSLISRSSFQTVNISEESYGGYFLHSVNIYAQTRRQGRLCCSSVDLILWSPCHGCATSAVHSHSGLCTLRPSLLSVGLQLL